MMGIKPSCTWRVTSLGSVTPSYRLTVAYIAFALPQSFYFAQFCAQPRRSLFCLFLCLNHNLLGDDPDLLYRSNPLCLLHPLTSSFSTFPKAVRIVPGDPPSVNRY